MNDTVPTQPRFARGFMLDSARCQECHAYYRAFIDFAAARGMNTLIWHFTDDQGCSLQLDAVPGIASPHAYTKAEMRDLIRYAADRGVQVVPELAALGHSRYLTRLPAYRHLNETDGAHFTGMCPVSPDTRRVVRALIEEVADLFDGPDFHVGLDEVNIGGHPLTRTALRTQTRGELLADYAAFLHGVVTGAGKRMWMWGDGLLKHPEMRAAVPRDVVICNWQYAPDPPPAATQTLLDAGFDVLLCSALISHDQPLFPGDRFALPNIRALDDQRALAGRGRVLGHVNTIWTPVRYVADSLWLGVDLAAAVLDGRDPGAQGRALGQAFHGLTGTDAARFADAARLLFEGSPLRDEWLSVATLEPLAPAMHDRVVAAAERWSIAHRLLTRVAPAVRMHRVEFRALALLLEVLHHTYDVAAQWADGIPSPATLARLVDRGETVLAAVDANWDRERYADDSRKYSAPIPSFQDDHLIPVLDRGLARLRAAVKASKELARV
jgi:hypothetical protein